MNDWTDLLTFGLVFTAIIYLIGAIYIWRKVKENDFTGSWWDDRFDSDE